MFVRHFLKVRLTLHYLPYNRPEDKEGGTARETVREGGEGGSEGEWSSVALYYAGSFRAAGAVRVRRAFNELLFLIMPFFFLRTV
jgi:hypothetical protein